MNPHQFALTFSQLSSKKHVVYQTWGPFLQQVVIILETPAVRVIDSVLITKAMAEFIFQ